MAGEKVTVNSRKYDGRIRRTWQCKLVERQESLVVLVGEFEQDIEHPGLGRINCGTLSHEYYWLDRWYNIFRFHEPNGTFRNYYCNVAMPPEFDGSTLDYVDLDIDILVWPDHRYEVVDRDDFQRNTFKYGYTSEIRQMADNSVDEIVRMIESKALPAV